MKKPAADTYSLDEHLTPAEATRFYGPRDEHGAPVATTTTGHYVYAIRHTGRPGWVFRFQRGDERSAVAITKTLNRHALEREAAAASTAAPPQPTQETA